MLKKFIFRVIILGFNLALGTANAVKPSNLIQITESQLKPSATTKISARITIKSTAPTYYVVKKNDSLVKIASLYVAKLSLWPKLFGLTSFNQIKLYPGDGLRLIKITANPFIVVEANQARKPIVILAPKIIESAIKGLSLIPTVNLNSLLINPIVMAESNYNQLAYVLGSSKEGQLNYTTGDDVYVKNYQGNIGDKVSFISKFRKLIDPQGKKFLGLELSLDGDGYVDDIESGIAHIEITYSRHEIQPLSRVIPFNQEDLPELIPYFESQVIRAQVIAFYNAISMNAENSSVVISKGSTAGVKIGQVYNIFSPVKLIDSKSLEDLPKEFKVPMRIIGELVIYKVYPQVSFGLITDSVEPITLYSEIRTAHD